MTTQHPYPYPDQRKPPEPAKINPPPESKSWTGEERRGIQIHVINYIDDRLKEHTSTLEMTLGQKIADVKLSVEGHTVEEMERYTAIQTQLKDYCDSMAKQARHSEDRHAETQHRINSLAQSIEAWMAGQDDFADAMKRAFPKDDETGKPDYDGHRTAHLAWITDSKESKEFKRYIRNVVLGAAAVAVTSWLTLLVWQGLLRGPQ